jgi:hypothetical protein
MKTTQDTANTFATVYRKVDRSLVTCCVEVASPKYDIFAAESSHVSGGTRSLMLFLRTIHNHIHTRLVRPHSKA